MTGRRRSWAPLIALTLLVVLVGTDSLAETQAQGQAAAGTQAVECHWIMEVDEQVDKDIEGVKHSYHLVLLMEKAGGTDKTGTYTGKLLLKTEQDIASAQEAVFEDEISLKGTNTIESHADGLKMSIVPFAGDVFAQYGFTKESPDAPLMPLAPIGEYDAMALEKPELSSTQTYSVVMTMEDGETADMSDVKTFISPILVKILISGADVNVYLQELNLSGGFKGTLTGIPTAP